MTDIGSWLVVLHMVGASVWLGTWVCVIAFAANAVAAPSEDAVRRLFAVMRGLGPAMIGPATLLVLGAGIALVLIYGVSWAAPWIVVGLAAFVLVTLVGVLVLGRYAKRVQRALADGDVDRAVADTRVWLSGAIAIAAVLLLATVDMVIRP